LYSISLLCFDWRLAKSKSTESKLEFVLYVSGSDIYEGGGAGVWSANVKKSSNSDGRLDTTTKGT